MLRNFQPTRELSRVCVGVAMLFMLAGSTHAQTFTNTYQQGDGGLYSTTDATYIQGQPGGLTGSNFGGATTMILETDVPSGETITRPMIRFPDIFGDAPGQIPLGAKINSATLTVTTGGGQFDASNNPTSIFQVLTDWDEGGVSGVTWDSFNSGGIAGVDYDGTALDALAPSALNSPFEFDVTAAIADMSAGSPNLGFLLISSGGDQAVLLSDDSGNAAGRPLLTVNYSVPEPASVAIWTLLGLAATGFGYYRVRRKK